jgi:hypothetical protein
VNDEHGVRGSERRDRRDNLVPPFEPGNDVAVKHGTHSERRIRPVAARHRRRLRRQFGLKDRDLAPLERGYLNLLARLLAKIELADAYIDEHGLIRDDGSPQPVMGMYVSLVNSARLTLAKLEDSLRKSASTREESLGDYIERAYGDKGERSG